MDDNSAKIAEQPPVKAGYPSEIETLLYSALVDIARALERRCYRTATKKAKDALAKVPSNIFDV